MAPVLTAGAVTTELRYLLPRFLRVQDSAGARPMRPHDRTPDRWTASRTLPEPQTQQTHNAELKGTNRQQKSEDDDAATQEPTGTRHGMHMANAPHYLPLGRRTAFATLPIPHKEQRHKEPRTDTHRPHTGLRDCSPADSAPVPTTTRLGTLTVDASLHPAPRVDGPHRPHFYSTTQRTDMRTR